MARFPINGWAQDASVPANVQTKGGTLTAGDLDGSGPYTEVSPTAVDLTAVDGNTRVRLRPDGTTSAVRVTPKSGTYGIEVENDDAPSGALNCHDLPIANLADPQDEQDAATKRYVDDAIAAAIAALTP